MTQWRPDPTFYPSPRMAMEVPAEKLDYLALLNPKYVGKHDALAVVDVDPLPLSSERTTSCGIGIIEEKCWWATETLRSGLS